MPRYVAGNPFGRDYEPSEAHHAAVRVEGDPDKCALRRLDKGDVHVGCLLPFLYDRFHILLIGGIAVQEFHGKVLGKGIVPYLELIGNARVVAG